MQRNRYLSGKGADTLLNQYGSPDVHTCSLGLRYFSEFFAISFSLLRGVLTCEVSVRSGFESSFIPSFAADPTPPPFSVLWTRKVWLKAGIVFVLTIHRALLPGSLLSSSWERALPFCLPDGPVRPKHWEVPMNAHLQKELCAQQKFLRRKNPLWGRPFGTGALDKRSSQGSDKHKTGRGCSQLKVVLKGRKLLSRPGDGNHKLKTSEVLRMRAENGKRNYEPVTVSELCRIRNLSLANCISLLQPSAKTVLL